ncbi:hypothetical protein [Parendozoicomonas sp. Alg238-R29]|uniref:hypothetical protein n=1 Tax=Parendozoicomonas sp. Alg238-R29 TaxID=2993446 RepID=UPI00248E91A3|nr:hypothetical protein [Parendozoicomonas sp. Alg238-R29]
MQTAVLHIGRNVVFIDGAELVELHKAASQFIDQNKNALKKSDNNYQQPVATEII